jgi:hypothetical protein
MPLYPNVSPSAPVTRDDLARIIALQSMQQGTPFVAGDYDPTSGEDSMGGGQAVSVSGFTGTGRDTSAQSQAAQDRDAAALANAAAGRGPIDAPTGQSTFSTTGVPSFAPGFTGAVAQPGSTAKTSNDALFESTQPATPTNTFTNNDLPSFAPGFTGRTGMVAQDAPAPDNADIIGNIMGGMTGVPAGYSQPAASTPDNADIVGNIVGGMTGVPGGYSQPAAPDNTGGGRTGVVSPGSPSNADIIGNIVGGMTGVPGGYSSGGDTSGGGGAVGGFGGGSTSSGESGADPGSGGSGLGGGVG